MKSQEKEVCYTNEDNRIIAILLSERLNLDTINKINNVIINELESANYNCIKSITDIKIESDKLKTIIDNLNKDKDCLKIKVRLRDKVIIGSGILNIVLVLIIL